MKLRKLVTIGLAGALLVGTITSASAAEVDVAWYAEQNPDVVAAVGDSPEALKLHYEMYGRKEARMANTKDVEARLRRLFKADEYMVLYPDVKEFYGDDEEGMFQHYIAYGLLEARRPGKKVSKAAAVSLKANVEKAMKDAGVEAVPGSAALVAVITGETASVTEAVADSRELEKVTKALGQVAEAVGRAVTEVVKGVTNLSPDSVPSNGGGSSSGGNSPGSDSEPSDGGGSPSGGNSPGSAAVPAQSLHVTEKTLYAKAAGGAYVQVTDSNVDDYFTEESGEIKARAGFEFASALGTEMFTEVSSGNANLYAEWKGPSLAVTDKKIYGAGGVLIDNDNIAQYVRLNDTKDDAYVDRPLYFSDRPGHFSEIAGAGSFVEEGYFTIIPGTLQVTERESYQEDKVTKITNDTAADYFFYEDGMIYVAEGKTPYSREVIPAEAVDFNGDDKVSAYVVKN